MDAPTPDVTTDLAAFVRDQIAAGDWLKSRRVSSEAIENLRIHDPECDEIGGYRLVRYGYEVVQRHEAGARLIAVMGHMRMPLNEMRVEYDMIVDERVEELVADVPDFTDVVDIAFD
jgi:hypothetical protein